jgi:hypothetical protein
MGLTLAQFDAQYDHLIARGFPTPDPDTGNFDLQAIDRWCDARHPHLFCGAIMQARDASTVVTDRIAKIKAAGGRPWADSNARLGLLAAAATVRSAH